MCIFKQNSARSVYNVRGFERCKLLRYFTTSIATEDIYLESYKLVLQEDLDLNLKLCSYDSTSDIYTSLSHK